MQRVSTRYFGTASLTWNKWEYWLPFPRWVTLKNYAQPDLWIKYPSSNRAEHQVRLGPYHKNYTHQCYSRIMGNIFRLSFLYCKLSLPISQYRIVYKSFQLSRSILTFYIFPNSRLFPFCSIYKVISLISFVLEYVFQTLESVLRLFASPFCARRATFPCSKWVILI